METRLDLMFLVAVLLAVRSNLCNCTKKDLWIGAFLTVDISDGGWSSAGVLPAIEMAIDDVNNNSQILADYDLRMEWRDTKVTCTIVAYMQDILFINIISYIP
jgi:gamma-aminobutyric acid type B receptor